MSPSIRLDGETQVVDSRVSRKRKSMVLSCCLITWEHLAILFSRCIFFLPFTPWWAHVHQVLIHCILYSCRIDGWWRADDEFGEKTVSVLLDGEESEMIFIDHASAEMSVILSTYYTLYLLYVSFSFCLVLSSIILIIGIICWRNSKQSPKIGCLIFSISQLHQCIIQQKNQDIL